MVFIETKQTIIDIESDNIKKRINIDRLSIIIILLSTVCIGICISVGIMSWKFSNDTEIKYYTTNNITHSMQIYSATDELYINLISVLLLFGCCILCFIFLLCIMYKNR
jgi:TRAP-type C4-dicarboxylate transport system permease small subunit